MNMLNDPSMKEIVLDFCKESTTLFLELDKILNDLENTPSDSKLMEKFGQVIDRVMGAAKSIGAEEIATFCELGKLIGYKASQISDPPLLTVVIAVLFDAVDLLHKMIKKLETGNPGQLQGLSTQAFVTRLKWLSEKFKNIERGSVAITGKDASRNMAQGSIDDLMKSLGL